MRSIRLNLTFDPSFSIVFKTHSLPTWTTHTTRPISAHNNFLFLNDAHVGHMRNDFLRLVTSVENWAFVNHGLPCTGRLPLRKTLNVELSYLKHNLKTGKFLVSFRLEWIHTALLSMVLSTLQHLSKVMLSSVRESTVVGRGKEGATPPHQSIIPMQPVVQQHL